MKPIVIFFLALIIFSCKEKQDNIITDTKNGVVKNDTNNVQESEIISTNKSYHNNSQEVKKTIDKLTISLIENGYSQEELLENSFVENIFKDNISFIKKKLTNPTLKVSTGEAFIFLIVYEYDSNQKSHEIFNVIKKERFKEEYLDKNWDVLTVLENYIIRIDAGCIISKDNWVIVKNIFKQVYEDDTKNIYCDCGGRCR